MATDCPIARDGALNWIWHSAKVEYALRACVVLASDESGALLKSHEIARRTGAPEGFLANILSELRRVGIVSAKRGYHGGYRLTCDPTTVSVAQLIDALSGSRPVDAHASFERSTFRCVNALWQELREQSRQRLETISLAQIAEDRPTVTTVPEDPIK